MPPPSPLPLSLKSHLTRFWLRSLKYESIHTTLHPFHMYMLLYISHESFVFLKASTSFIACLPTDIKGYFNVSCTQVNKDVLPYIPFKLPTEDSGSYRSGKTCISLKIHGMWRLCWHHSTEIYLNCCFSFLFKLLKLIGDRYKTILTSSTKEKPTKNNITAIGCQGRRRNTDHSGAVQLPARNNVNVVEGRLKRLSELSCQLQAIWTWYTHSDTHSSLPHCHTHSRIWLSNTGLCLLFESWLGLFPSWQLLQTTLVYTAVVSWDKSGLITWHNVDQKRSNFPILKPLWPTDYI